MGRRGTARREDPRDPWENGSRRADSPRSNASLTVSLSLCALLPHHPFLRLVRRPTPRARARARRLSHPHALLCRRASPPIIPPPLSPLFRPLSPPRAHLLTFVRHIYVDTWAPEWKCSLRRGRFFIALFYFPSRNICALDLPLWIFLFLVSYFFLFFSHSTRILIVIRVIELSQGCVEYIF